jgi:predicted ABC-type ATPase
VPIFDQDLAAYHYKKRGFSDYQDLASLTSSQRIRESLFKKTDFALELNLGFLSHYDFLKSIASFDWSNTIHLLLFFTDDLNLCIDRAQIRYISGGHEVKQEVIEEMYSSTLPLFEQNKNLFHSIRLVNVTYDTLTELTPHSKPLPEWVLKNDLQLYL